MTKLNERNVGTEYADLFQDIRETARAGIIENPCAFGITPEKVQELRGVGKRTRGTMIKNIELYKNLALLRKACELLVYNKPVPQK